MLHALTSSLWRPSLALGLVLAFPVLAHATPQDCELNGEPVNPDNSVSIGTKSGVMRCRFRDTHRLTREEELRHGAFVGAVREYHEGVLAKDYSEDAAGKRDGEYREYAADSGRHNPLLLEQTYRHGKLVGRSHAYYPTGELERVIVYDDDGHQLAMAELNKAGQLADLQCADHPVLAPDVNDEEWCGDAPEPKALPLYDAVGRVRARVRFVHGERAYETRYHPDGSLDTQIEPTETGSVERTFGPGGVMSDEREFTGHGKSKVLTSEQAFYPSGTKERERRWERGELVLDEYWYPNGQPRSKRERAHWNDFVVTQDSEYREDGTLASEGAWRESENTFGPIRVGPQKTFDEHGTLRFERTFDGQGRPIRERTWDETGKLIRDDEVREDGSRHARYVAR
jgi:antitoxin component YwqK of YwqJK toxin-antitoxin module